MSGITGIFFRDGKFIKNKQIKDMNECLSHRGPDGNGIWVEESVGMGHQMLHTTLESINEKLPFNDDVNNMTITADARIDNRDELSSLLDVENCEDVPDSSYILKAYQKWGEKCTEKLLGDFSFAIWDNNRKIIFCARDHIGIKPFYYYLSEEIFIFASEIKAILDVWDDLYQVNESKIADYLVPIGEDTENTFYKDILRLPPAHSISVSQKNRKLQCYWMLNPDKKIIFDSDEDYFRNFHDIFNEAVKCRLRSVNPVGCRLSGGLDSSSVASVARVHLQNEGKPNLRTFSAVFDDLPECDEQYYIKKIVEEGGIEPFFISVHNLSPLSSILRAMDFLDEPYYAPNYYINHKIFSEVQNQSIRVLLDGVDGDRIVSHGNGYLIDLAYEIQLFKLFKEMKCISNRLDRSMFKIFIFNVIFPLLPLNVKMVIMKLLGMDGVRNLDYLNVDLAQRTGIKEIFYESYIKPTLKNTRSREIHYQLITTGVVQHFLELADHRAAQFSVEARHPFYDKRLIDFCLAVPNNLKTRFGWDRYIMRKAMQGILPSEIQWRAQKTNLGKNFTRNVMRFDLHDIDEIIQNNKFIEDYVDLTNLKESYNKLNEGNGSELFKLWKVITLNLWLLSIIKIDNCDK